ncbi:MAG: hypothetical protein QXT25_03310 [Candidatus Anstonellaceae archaeon]
MKTSAKELFEKFLKKEGSVYYGDIIELRHTAQELKKPIFRLILDSEFSKVEKLKIAARISTSVFKRVAWELGYTVKYAEAPSWREQPKFNENEIYRRTASIMVKAKNGYRLNIATYCYVEIA